MPQLVGQRPHEKRGIPQDTGVPENVKGTASVQAVPDLSGWERAVLAQAERELQEFARQCTAAYGRV